VYLKLRQYWSECHCNEPIDKSDWLSTRNSNILFSFVYIPVVMLSSSCASHYYYQFSLWNMSPLLSLSLFSITSQPILTNHLRFYTIAYLHIITLTIRFLCPFQLDLHYNNPNLKSNSQFNFLFRVKINLFFCHSSTTKALQMLLRTDKSTLIIISFSRVT